MPRYDRLWIAPTWVAIATLSFTAACGDAEDLDAQFSRQAVTIPGQGGSTTLDIATWNIEWFGSSSRGPTNESLQSANARDVIAGTDFDIWGLQEIVSQSAFNNLESSLSGYSGFTARESVVSGGASYYSSSEQKVALLYKSSVATLQSARIILTQNNYQFAGRPPLEATFDVNLNGHTEELVVIVLHMKAFSDTSSWARRRDASIALKGYLDSTHPDSKVVVIGDFNDDLDTSITSGQDSPYENFLLDPADYGFPTEVLTNAGESSTTGYPDMIDHQLATNELDADYRTGSAQVYSVDAYISNYDNTTSDHYPVLARYDWAAGGSGGAVFMNEIRANEPGSNTAGEFIELVNPSATSVNIGGWTLSDSSRVRHQFASNTVLAPGSGIVVFGGASAIPGGLSNAVAASTGTLSLRNSGESVTLRNSGGTTVDTINYRSSLASQDGVSMNRNPDGDATGAWVRHNTLVSAGSSPGTRVNGVSW